MKKYTIYDELEEIIGEHNVKKLVKYVGGQQIYFPKTHSKQVSELKKQISSECNGKNYRQLSIKYGYSERWIRKICNNYNSKD